MLVLEEATFGYTPARPVVNAVTASLAPARLTVLLGPNGAGKSTLLRLLAGLRAPTRGRVLFGGAPVVNMTETARAGCIAYMPQNSPVAFDYTVAQVAAMGLYGARGGPTAAREALGSVGVLELAEEPFAALSAGQQQRVTLARTLAQMGPKPEGKFLLADEPVSAMDPVHALGAMELLRRTARRGAGVVVVLHDLALALRFADEVLLLGASGRLLACGPCAEVLRAPALESLFGIGFEELRDAERNLAAFVPVRN